MIRRFYLVLVLAGLCGLPLAAVSAFTCVDLVSSEPSSKEIAFSRGLLWRVRGAAQRPSYLFGTIHLSDPRVTQLSDAVEQALAASERIGTEVELDQSALQQMARAMYYNDGTRLTDVIGPALFAKTLALLNDYGVNRSMAERLKPWAAYTSLSLPPAQTALPLDVVLVARARAASKATFGLETIEEQIAVFDSLNQQEQTEFLTEAVCHYGLVQREIEEMLGFYLAQDLGALMLMSERYRSPLKDKFIDVLLRQRNLRMAERMRVELDQGAAFIAIGALHLPGEQGVLQLLKNHGYELERVE